LKSPSFPSEKIYRSQIQFFEGGDALLESGIVECAQEIGARSLASLYRVAIVLRQRLV
jgi:hypothetical protein